MKSFVVNLIDEQLAPVDVVGRTRRGLVVHHAEIDAVRIAADTEVEQNHLHDWNVDIEKQRPLTSR